MELEEVIRQRRSIRKFKSTPIEEAKLEKLIEAARLCPSAKNRQPWRFMILKAEIKDQIADIMLHLFESHDEKLPGYVNSSRYTAEIIKTAPVLILVLRETDELWTTGDLLSIGAAIEHIGLAAVDLGLGSLWIRDTEYTEKEITELIGYPELQLVSAIALGYPAEHPEPRPRKPQEALLLHYRKH